MIDIAVSPFFGITLSAVCFEFGVYLNKRTGSPLTNPLLIAIVLCILVLKVLNIPTASYAVGGDIISMMLAPVTAVLAVSIYDQINVLKKNLIPILSGTIVGSIASVASAYLLCRAFDLDDTLTASLLPKSVTTPIAVEISAQLGGSASITAAAVIFTGILGAIFSPLLIRVFRIENKVARGIAIGTSSHAMGTSRALELGETEGAMSSVSVGIAGVVTVVISMLL